MFEELKRGDTGNNVVILQQKLKMLGFYNANITGSFGEATEEGVYAFQREAGLLETGTVSNDTWEALYRYTQPAISPISNYPTLSYGASGDFVVDLQTKLKALLYYMGDINGKFDLETENAVRRFQLNNELTADGIVGNRTWDSLNMLYGNLNDCVLDNDDGSDNVSSYVVQSGDTLYSIAKKFNTTIDAIKVLNNLNSNTIRVGQILEIPVREDDGYIKYTVVSGDTLYGIARKYNTSVDAIKNFNNLSSDVISVGQILNIPTKSDDTYIDYVVEKGDTLYSIARKYNVSVDTIKSVNNLSSNILQIGQVIRIPSDAGTNYVNYKVVSGDTLYGIAKKYNTSVDAIKNFNNLNSNILRIGQVLKIPV